MLARLLLGSAPSHDAAWLVDTPERDERVLIGASRARLWIVLRLSDIYLAQIKESKTGMPTKGLIKDEKVW